jgi:hypothetical protein
MIALSVFDVIESCSLSKPGDPVPAERERTPRLLFGDEGLRRNAEAL